MRHTVLDKLDDRQKKRLIMAYGAGATTLNLAKRFHVSAATVRNVLKSAGVCLEIGRQEYGVSSRGRSLRGKANFWT